VSVTPVAVLQVPPGDRERWEAFLGQAAQGTVELGQRWAFHDLLHDVLGLKVIRLAACRGSRWVAVLPLALQHSFLGTFLTSLPYLDYGGIHGSDPEARQALALEALSLARSRRADRLELRGRDGQDLPIATWQGKASYVRALPDASGLLWEELGAKVRAQVKRPMKEGYRARIVEQDGHRRFWPLLARRWHELGSPILPERFFSRLGQLFAGGVDYVFVERDGELAAAGVLVRDGERAEICWAASATEHNRYGVNMLVYWAALERAIERRARSVGFGRSTPGSGHARFKLQWGAREELLHWNVHVATRRGSAAERETEQRQLAAAVWRRIPAFLAQRLGPALAARIPL
jgi:FemAB-related protein (PEP-CTERM system-associated)